MRRQAIKPAVDGTTQVRDDNVVGFIFVEETDGLVDLLSIAVALGIWSGARRGRPLGVVGEEVENFVRCPPVILKKTERLRERCSVGAAEM